MPPRSDPPPLTANELRLLARLEGRPLPRGPELEAALGARAPAALRLIRKLRRQGWLTFGALVGPPLGACVCVSYLQIDWSRASTEALEERMRQDPAILVADRILGASDYRLFSSHTDHRDANAWIRELGDTPGVARVTTRFCARIRDRPRFAAARLAADEASDRCA